MFVCLFAQPDERIAFALTSRRPKAQTAAPRWRRCVGGAGERRPHGPARATHACARARARARDVTRARAPEPTPRAPWRAPAAAPAATRTLDARARGARVRAGFVVAAGAAQQHASAQACEAAAGRRRTRRPRTQSAAKGKERTPCHAARSHITYPLARTSAFCAPILTRMLRACTRGTRTHTATANAPATELRAPPVRPVAAKRMAKARRRWRTAGGGGEGTAKHARVRARAPHALVGVRTHVFTRARAR